MRIVYVCINLLYDFPINRGPNQNERLKRIVARQALELEVKTELLKKTPIVSRIK
jgi:hypothetical protein